MVTEILTTSVLLALGKFIKSEQTDLALRLLIYL